MKQIRLPYGNTEILFDAPERAQIFDSNIDQLRGEGNGREIVCAAMRAPIDSPTLKELAVGKKRCTIIISDHTRPVPSQDILPPMLAELRAGNPEIEITLLVATGFHRMSTMEELRRKVGDAIFTQEKIVVHDCRSNNVLVGTLPSGAPLILDRLAAETDLLVAEGFIEPHFFAGFSGGRKSVLPGVCDRATVLGNHCSRFIDSPFARTGVLDGNPIHEDMLAAAKMVHLAYVVNVIIDEKKNTAAAFAGDFEAAHRKGCDFLRQYCVVRPNLSDVAVTTNGGAPLDQNIYQCVKSLTAAEACVRDGGVIILCAECADGTGGDDFYRTLRDCENAEQLYESILKTPKQETIPDQWESQILARILKHHPVIMVTREALKPIVEDMKMRYASTVKEALALAEEQMGAEYSLNIIPNVISVIVEP